MTSLPAAPTLPQLADADRQRVLDLLFEPSPPLHALSLPVLCSTTFGDYDALIGAVDAQLGALARSDAPAQIGTLDAILSAHPRLGEKKVESEQSRAEQAQLQASAGAGAEAEKEMLGRLNAEYEARFPGLRYVVFVNGRSRPVVMEDMRARIERGDIDAERREAIRAMCDIAADRAAKLQK